MKSPKKSPKKQKAKKKAKKKLPEFTPYPLSMVLMNKDPRFGLNEGEYYLDEDGDYMDEFCLKVSSTDTDCSIYHDGKWKDSKLPWDKSVYDFDELVDLSDQTEFN